MKVLLTDATGLLGGHLLQALQQRSEQIRALVLPVEREGIRLAAAWFDAAVWNSLLSPSTTLLFSIRAAL
jgi:uncharacterized protein YbjT (DUF2867 family)